MGAGVMQTSKVLVGAGPLTVAEAVQGRVQYHLVPVNDPIGLSFDREN
jgi:hypothetical protein